VVIDRHPSRREDVPVVEGYTIDAEVGGRWDGRADAWDIVSRTPAFGRFRDAILAAAGIGRDDVVVDVGCGTGLVTLPAAELARSAIGIDASGTMLERLHTMEQLLVDSCRCGSLEECGDRLLARECEPRSTGSPPARDTVGLLNLVRRPTRP